jgi:hypothetical protein
MNIRIIHEEVHSQGAIARARVGRKAISRWWACDRCGFSCPWWNTADSFDLCAACDRAERLARLAAQSADNEPVIVRPFNLNMQRHRSGAEA